jgi:hypothetical protein
MALKETFLAGWIEGKVFPIGTGVTGVLQSADFA